MNSLIIGRIKIENFKPIKYFDEDFNASLVIMDGPNGFGKTSIFDALELVIFDKINRIETNNIVHRNQAYRDSLFHNDANKDVLIQVEFINNDKSFVVSKRLKADVNYGRATRNHAPHVWEFETYITDSFVSNFSKEVKVTQDQIIEKIGNKTLLRAYHLFYYIQQEEKTFFLKRKERDRLAELSALFDTKNEEEELNRYRSIQSSVNRRINNLGADKAEIQKKIDELNEFLNEDETDKNEALYKRILTNIDNIPEWDKKLSNISKDTRDKFLEELNALKGFIIDFQDYEKILSNNKIHNLLQNSQLLKQTVIVGSFLELEVEMSERFRNQQQLRQFKKTLEKEKLFQNIETENLSGILTELEKYEIKLNKPTILEMVNNIKQLRKNTAVLSSLVLDLNQARESLNVKFELFVKKSEIQNGVCPLCGHDWGALDILMQSIDEKKQQFKNYYDSSAKEAEELFSDLYKNFIVRLVNELDSLLKLKSNQIDEEFYYQFRENLGTKESVQKFLGWCETNNLNIRQYLNKEEIVLSEEKQVQLIEKIKEEINTMIQNVNNEKFETEEHIHEMNRIYKEYFNQQKENFKMIDEEAINEKIKYINATFYLSNHETIIKLTKEKKQKEEEANKLGNASENINKIIEIYDRAIRHHWARIIKDIELVFYIYSGKIIQYYQRGLGIFIRQSRDGSEEAQAIRFISGPDKDHDALHYLSSGQLSALVISFTFALNKVYGKGGLNVILIDDPVQTMDDLNMASFTELLRNDFATKQVILSTHEDHISKYLAYKYIRYGLNRKSINMKKKLIEY